jgi:hypothetical protein
MNNNPTHECEYCNCDKPATIFVKELDAWLCEKHEDGSYNSSGYCSQSCQLGYGCDGSC